VIVARAARILALGSAALIVLAGCTSDAKPGPTTFVTVSAGPPVSAGGTVPPANGRSTAKRSRSAPPPSIPTKSKLPGTCDTLLPLGSVVDALGQKVPGATAFVVGQPDSATGRLTYLNCRYGVSKKNPVPLVEIGVNLYRTAAKATGRIPPTVDDYTNHAAKATTTTVAGRPATLLDGGVGPGYSPTLVLAVGQRTIAVSVRAGAVPPNRLVKGLVALAALATKQTS
jgi:hypothetical protein